MGNRFASSQKAHGFCDRCGLRYPLRRLRKLTIKTKTVSIMVCPSCWEEDHPQLLLGMYPVDDPQALRTPRPDNSYWQGGQTGLQVSDTVPSDNVLAFGTPSSGSRVIQWGWNPVGLNNVLELPGLVDVMEMHGQIGDVVIDCQSIRQDVTGLEAMGEIGDVEFPDRVRARRNTGTGEVGVLDATGTSSGTLPSDQGIGEVGTVTVTTV